MAGTDRQVWAKSGVAKALAEGWAEGFEQVISVLDASGRAEDVRLELARPQPEIWAAWVNPLWFELPCDAAAGASLHAGCALDSARALAVLLSGDESQAEQETRDAYREILNQAAGALSGAFWETFESAVSFSPAAASNIPGDTAFGLGFRFKVAGATHVIALVPNQSLVQALLEKDGSELEAAPSEENPQPRAAARSEAAGEAVPGSAQPPSPDTNVQRNNIDLLLEIEMQLAVSFGRTHMALEEVLKLSSGAIVELNRAISDPVDVMVNDAVIARGEVVVVEGNYGVRITEIVSRRERIRSIF